MWVLESESEGKEARKADERRDKVISTTRKTKVMKRNLHFKPPYPFTGASI